MHSLNNIKLAHFCKALNIRVLPCFLLLFGIHQLLWGQDREFESIKDFTCYFDIKDVPLKNVFPQNDLNTDKSFFKYILTLKTILRQKNDSLYIVLSVDKHKNDCMARYRNFLIQDAIFADKMACSVNVYVEDEPYKTYFVDYKVQQTEKVLLDTFCLLSDNANNIQASVLNLHINFDTIALQKMRQRKEMIDNYYCCDSLFQKYHADLNKIDTTFVDRFPL